MPNIGSGQVLEKIPGSRSGSGGVGVLKYRIGYFGYWVLSFLLWVFLGIPGYFVKEPPTTTQDCLSVIPEIPSHVWEHQEMGNTRNFGFT